MKQKIIEKNLSMGPNSSIEYNKEKLLQFSKKPLYWKNAPVKAYQHFWRQFIDGWQQVDAGFVASFGSEMKKKFAMDFERADFASQAMVIAATNYEFREFIQQWSLYKTIAEGINSKGLIKFGTAAKITNGWLSFENNGKNYLLAMSLTKALLKNLKGQKITKEIIEIVHRSCTENVGGLVTSSVGYRPAEGNRAGYFSLLIGYNTSEKGALEWLTLVRERAMQGRLYRFRRSENSYWFLSYNSETEKFCCDGFSDYEKAYDWEEIHALLFNEFKIGITPITRKAELDSFFLELSNYYGKLEQCEDLYNKMLVTVRLIKNSLVEHPFFDGNLRVFGMLILPHLLESLGLGDMYFWKDANIFAMYSDEECISAIVEGIENAQMIYQGEPCSLQENSSMTQIWSALSLEEKVYFYQCLQVYPFESQENPAIALRELSSKNAIDSLLQAILLFSPEYQIGRDLKFDPKASQKIDQFITILTQLPDSLRRNILEHAHLDLGALIQNKDQLVCALDKIAIDDRLFFLEQSQLDLRSLISDNHDLKALLDQLPPNAHKRFLKEQGSCLEFEIYDEYKLLPAKELPWHPDSFFQPEPDIKANIPRMTKFTV